MHTHGSFDVRNRKAGLKKSADIPSLPERRDQHFQGSVVDGDSWLPRTLTKRHPRHGNSGGSAVSEVLELKMNNTGAVKRSGAEKHNIANWRSTSTRVGPRSVGVVKNTIEILPMVSSEAVLILLQS